MNKDWFILVNGEKKGPYTPLELKKHPEVNPDTWVQKIGWVNWIAIRYVEELRDVFKDKVDSSPLSTKKDVAADLSQDQATLTITQPDPIHPYLWILLMTGLLIYLIYIFAT